MKLANCDDDMTMRDILYWCIIGNAMPDYKFIEGKLYRKNVKP